MPSDSVLACCQRFLENLFVTVRIQLSPVASREPDRSFDPRLVLSQPRALAALRQLAGALAAEGYDNSPASGPVSRLALGHPVDPETLVGVLPREALDSLSAAGATRPIRSGLQLAFCMLAVNGTLAVVPRDGRRPDAVYLGPDSALLVEAILALAPGGDCAVDIGTGTGLLAAVMARRYRRVLACDIVPRVASIAALTLALNRFPNGHRTGACLSDAASALRPGSFDLVAANPPWAPSPIDPRRRLVYAHGGDTGFELPRRIILEGCSLLRPGGLAVTLTADFAHRDGSRPLGELCRDLNTRGWTTAVVPTPFPRVVREFEVTMLTCRPDLRSADHVAVIVQRPGASTGDEASEVALGVLSRQWAGR